MIIAWLSTATAFRSDFCLGMDDFHTSEELVERVETILESCGYSTARDQPFSGTIVPMKHYRKDYRVHSLIIEINRRLYLGDDYWVYSERIQKLISMLGGVGEMLTNNWIFNTKSQIGSENQGSVAKQLATIALEFSSTVILYSGQTRTLPVEVFAQVLQGNFGDASVVRTVLIAFTLVPIVVLFKLFGKNERSLVWGSIIKSESCLIL